jgi:oleate hydratase
MSPDQHNRDPQAVQCWLVGGGIGCLAAAVYLMEVGVPGTHIHFIEVYSQSNQSVTTFGNAEDGYTIHAGLQPYFHDPCVEDLLRLVPDPSNPERSLNEIVKDDARRASQIPKASTRLLVQGKSGPERCDTKRLHMRLEDRLDLAKMMIDSEENLGDKSIRQVFNTEFFASKFWILWSTT